MEVINVRNVNEAYYYGLELLTRKGERQPSRAGEVLVLPTPLTTVYNNSIERVLFDKQRDANPFFHLFESLWMLGGMSDARWLDQFVGDFSKRFAEKGRYEGILHGAYGYRWRHHYDYDQLHTVITKLKTNPHDRQAVITMWDPSITLLGCADLTGEWLDRPCNTHVYLRVRDEGIGGGKRLDMTVCCRSNDAVWGAYGSNVVCFSMLQEYLASQIGVGIGRYYQISNNFHVYLDILGKISNQVGEVVTLDNPYAYGEAEAYPMITDPVMFEGDLASFIGWWRRFRSEGVVPPSKGYANSWFSTTAEQLFKAHVLWKERKHRQAMYLVQGVTAPDWRKAAQEWMARRLDKLEWGVG